MRGKIGISKLWGIVTGLLVIGIIVYFGMLWVTSQNISARIKEVKTVTYKYGENKVNTCFVIEVNNTGLIDVTIEKLYYKIYVQGQYLGEGVKENLVIGRGTNEETICLETPPSDALKTILVTLIHKGRVNVTVKGYIDIPIKSFGLIKLWTLELPFEKTVEVNLVASGQQSSGGKPGLPGNMTLPKFP